MTQDEIMRMAREAGLQPYYDEQLTAIARFASIVAATEREKCTNTQEFVTLPREVVERALAALDAEDPYRAAVALRAALEQPPTTEQSSAVQQPQAEQEPVAWVWFDANERPCSVTFGGPNINTPKDWGVSPLYTHPQPKRNPLDVEEIHRLWGEIDGWFNFARAIEAAHNIK